MNHTNQESQFNIAREIYVENISKNQYPIFPAFYYYSNHTSNKNVLSQAEFEHLFMKSVKDYLHPISQEFSFAVMDIDQVFNILNGYYNIQYLLDKDGEVLKIV